MEDREAILSALPSATPAGPFKAELPPSDLPDQDLWETFRERLADLGGTVAVLADLAQFASCACAIDNDASKWLDGLGLSGAVPGDEWKADVGITMAECAVAETGSVVVAAGPGRRRMASLAPSLHVVLVDRTAIFATLEEAMPSLGARTSVIITGTSRTADIEGVLVRGVHGPRELWVVPLSETLATPERSETGDQRVGG